MKNVVLKNLTKKFGDVFAVKSLSLEAKAGEFLVLLGPSGCGKTTTLRCIAGLEDPDEGEIYIGDELANKLPSKDRDIAMVFQNYALYPHMKAFDNMSFPLRMHKVPKNEIKQRVKETAETLRISHLLDRKPKQLSGGEAQRVALGRAMVRNPHVFLMDEPLSNLDAKLRIYMRMELKRLQKEINVTTIYVTHDQVEAMTMADQIAVMNQGVLQQLDSPKMIFNHPSNLFVATFIGSPPMNYANYTFVEKKGLYRLDAGEFSIPIQDYIAKAIKEKATSSEMIVGIRAEDISLGRKRTAENYIEAEVYVTEPLGSEMIIDSKVGDKIFKVKVAADSPFGFGDKVWIGFNKEKIHLFDKKTEMAIV